MEVNDLLKHCILSTKYFYGAETMFEAFNKAPNKELNNEIVAYER